MNIQARGYHPELSHARSLSYKQVLVLMKEETKNLAARRRALIAQQQAKAQARKEAEEKVLLNAAREKEALEKARVVQKLLEEMLPLSPIEEIMFSKGDASTVSSYISLTSRHEPEEQIWDLRDYPVAVKKCRKNSYTIEVYDREHRKGDSLWFRASCNGTAGYQEFEDMEIIKFVKKTLQSNPSTYFYLKTNFGENDDASITLFASNFIVEALWAILERAQREDGIIIPKKWMLLELRAIRREYFRTGGFYWRRWYHFWS